MVPELILEFLALTAVLEEQLFVKCGWALLDQINQLRHDRHDVFVDRLVSRTEFVSCKVVRDLGHCAEEDNIVKVDVLETLWVHANTRDEAVQVRSPFACRLVEPLVADMD